MYWLKGCIVSLVILTMSAIVGCGDGGPTRYDISGNVRFKGEPVKSGRIVFEPIDPQKGNGGFASIADGKYDTRNAGAGHLGGPHKISIAGFSDEFVRKNDPDSGQKPLFPKYVIDSQDIGTSSTADFEVPAN